MLEFIRMGISLVTSVGLMPKSGIRIKLDIDLKPIQSEIPSEWQMEKILCSFWYCNARNVQP